MTQTDATTTTAVPSAKLVKANSIVDRDAKWAYVAGLIPAPMLDVAMIAAAQLKMLKSLADHYEKPFNANAAKSIISTLLGSIIPAGLGVGSIGSWMKAIPVAGPFLGIVFVPTLASAATYAIGKVFITHFESGGTFLNFDPVAVESEYRTLIAKRTKELEKVPA